MRSRAAVHSSTADCAPGDTQETTKAVAAAIGTANQAYAKGDMAMFAIDDGTSAAVFKFVSSGNDAVVAFNELTQIATLTEWVKMGAPDPRHRRESCNTDGMAAARVMENRL